MSVAELQRKIIEKISETDDVVLLEDIFNFMEADQNTATFYTLSKSQLSAIEASQQQIAAGEFLTNEQVNSQIDEWLEK